MRLFRKVVVLFALAGVAPALHAGVHYSGEQIADLPSQWRGFLLDQRALRNIAMASPSGLRQQYEKDLRKLEQSGRPLGADELADQGALYIRIGEPAKAVQFLRTAMRD